MKWFRFVCTLKIRNVCSVNSIISWSRAGVVSVGGGVIDFLFIYVCRICGECYYILRQQFSFILSLGRTLFPNEKEFWKVNTYTWIINDLAIGHINCIIEHATETALYQGSAIFSNIALYFSNNLENEWII